LFIQKYFSSFKFCWQLKRKKAIIHIKLISRRMFAIIETMLQNWINVRVKLLLIIKEYHDVLTLKIYSGNELFKIYSLSPQECMTMKKKIITFSTWEKGNCWNNLGSTYPIIKKGFLDHSSFSKPSKAYHLSLILK